MRCGLRPRWKVDALRFVQRANERAEVVAEHAREGKVFRRDDVDGDVTRAERRRHLESDEARADHDGALRAFAASMIARLSASVRR